MIATARTAKLGSLQQVVDALGTIRLEGIRSLHSSWNDVEHNRCEPSAELLPAIAKIRQLNIDCLYGFCLNIIH